MAVGMAWWAMAWWRTAWCATCTMDVRPGAMAGILHIKPMLLFKPTTKMLQRPSPMPNGCIHMVMAINGNAWSVTWCMDAHLGATMAGTTHTKPCQLSTKSLTPRASGGMAMVTAWWAMVWWRTAWCVTCTTDALHGATTTGTTHTRPWPLSMTRLRPRLSPKESGGMEMDMATSETAWCAACMDAHHGATIGTHGCEATKQGFVMALRHPNSKLYIHMIDRWLIKIFRT